MKGTSPLTEANGHPDPNPAPPRLVPARPQPNEAPDDPFRLARLYLAERHPHPERPTLAFFRAEFHEWDGAAWRPLPIEELSADVADVAKAEMDRVNLIAVEMAKRNGEDKLPQAKKVTSRMVGDIRHALAALTVLPAAKNEPPCWLGEPGPFPAAETLAARNGLVHLDASDAAEAVSLPPTPRFFCTSALDFDYDPGAPAPVCWQAFLDTLWPHDAESREALQEWFGYCLTPDTRQQKIMMIVGPKRSGKGTISRILTELVGRKNVAGPTLSGLATNFGLSPLLGKPLAVIDDARLSGKSDPAVVSERLLTISGEGGITIDRKNMSAVTATLPTRFLILTNELPRLGDASGALASRFVILRTTRSFYGQEDHGLFARLRDELPGVLLWAIQGRRRLQDRGRFVQPAAARQDVEDLEDLSSPVGAFVRERCIIDAGASIETGRLFDAWSVWCVANKRHDSGDEARFGRDLRAAAPGVVKRQTKCSATGERGRIYEGLRLRQLEDPDPQQTPADTGVHGSYYAPNEPGTL